MNLKFSTLPNYVKIYPIVSLFFNISMGILAPIQIIFYRHIGISLFQIGLLSTILEISIAVFEIPTGFIADKLGRNISVSSSFICFTISGIIFLLIRNMSGLIAATFIQGIGCTLMSGAFQAWGVDKLISNKDNDLVDILIISVTKMQKTGYLLGSILGGYMGLKLIDEVWYLYIFINVLCLILTIVFMKESQTSCDDAKQEEQTYDNLLNRLFSIDSSIVIKFIVVLGFVCILHEFSLSPIDEYWTVYFTENMKLQTSALGWIIAFVNILIVLLVSPCNEYLKRKFKTIDTLKILIFSSILSIVLLVISNNLMVSILFYVIFRFSLGIYSPIYESYINSLIKGNYRATILSFSSMLGGIGEIISGVSIGIIAECISIKVSFLFSAAGFLVLIVLFVALQHISNSLST